MHMCGKTNGNSVDGCEENFVQTQGEKQLDGTFCECRTDGCNISTILLPLFSYIGSITLTTLMHCLVATRKYSMWKNYVILRFDNKYN